MFTLLCRKLTCLAWVAGLAFVGTMLLAPAASAEGGSMYGTHTFGQVAAACGSAGGTFNVRPDGGYGCKTVNKDGSTKGVIYCDGDGSCSYSCSNCPAVAKGGLHGVLRPPASAGVTPSNRSLPALGNKVKSAAAFNHSPPKKFAARASRVH
jgi:hypothetical protein